MILAKNEIIKIEKVKFEFGSERVKVVKRKR